MNLLDRYTGRQIAEKDLPEHIDFGRFAITDSPAKPVEITYSNFPTKKIIHQELLLDKYRSLQEVLLQINNRVSIAKDGVFDVAPLIQRIKDKLGLNSFETMLGTNIFHIEEVFRQPHYLLEREIEKVHVSRAKRIPSKSYQYLASHTEDWIHKSIVSFKPSRILNEELDLNFDVYENQLSVTFVERCLVYLNSRLKEIQDIKSFLEDYKKLLQNREDDKGWYKKIERNLRLIGSVYEDDHYHGKGNDGSTLSDTEQILIQLNNRLLLLRKSELFYAVNKKTTQTLSLRNTNVLVNHKHYRYVKTLWIELDRIKPEKSEKEKLQSEQGIFDGVLAYAIALIAYCVKNYFGYEIKGGYWEFSGIHSFYPNLYFKVDSNRIINITIGQQNLKLIVIGNKPEEPDIISKILVNQNSFLLSFSEQVSEQNSRILYINPLDPDSCERTASLFMKYLVKNYLDCLNAEYIFPQLLKEYVNHFPKQYLYFDNQKYTYKFISFPKKEVNGEDVKIKVESDEKYKSLKSRIDKDNIIKGIFDLANQININSELLKKKHLKCISCGEALSPHSVQSFEYLVCQNCQNLVDSSSAKMIKLKNMDPRFESLTESDWGMDYLCFNSQEL